MKAESTGMNFKKLLDAFIDQDEFGERTPGEVVRHQRKKLEWTLEDLAGVTGIRAQNLSSIENGRIAMTVHYAELFGAAFDIPAVFFLYPNGQPEPSKELETVKRRAIKLKIDGRSQKKKASKKKRRAS